MEYQKEFDKFMEEYLERDDTPVDKLVERLDDFLEKVEQESNDDI